MADPYAGRRYSDRTGKGLYEDQVDGLSSLLRQVFSGGGSPRKTEGVIEPTAASQPQPTSSQKTNGAHISVSQDDAAQRPGLMAGYSATQTGIPGVTRVDGGRNPLFTNIDPREAIEGLRGGTVSSVGDTNEGLSRMARANAIRQEYLDSFGGPKAASIGVGDAVEQFNEMYDARREGMRRGLRPGQVLARDRDYSSALASFLRNQSSESDRQANIALASMREEGANARDAARLGLEREKFEFDKQPKPMSEIDKVRLAEAQYGLSKARADAAAAAADRAGVSPEDRTRLFQNFGGDGGLTDLSPDRMDGAIAQQAIGLRANDLANQYSIGGATSSKMFTPTKEDKYTWGDMRFWDDDPNTPNAWQTLTSSAGDVVVGDDGRRLNAAGLRKATKDIDLLGRLTKPRN